MNYDKLAGNTDSHKEKKIQYKKKKLFFCLLDHCKAAGISPWNNNWGNIHDFTTIPDGKNYSLINKVNYYY